LGLVFWVKVVEEFKFWAMYMDKIVEYVVLNFWVLYLDKNPNPMREREVAPRVRVRANILGLRWCLYILTVLLARCYLTGGEHPLHSWLDKCHFLRGKFLKSFLYKLGLGLWLVLIFSINRMFL